MGDFTRVDSDTLKINRIDNANMWQGFEFGRPGSFVYHFDDFFTFTGAEWVVTETGVNTQAISDGHAGRLLLTNAAADNDLTSIQMGNTGDATTGESLLPADGRTIYLECRMVKSDATQSDWLFGLVTTDTTPLSSTTGYFFQKDDGDTNVDVWTNGSTTLSVATDDTSFHKYGIRINGTTDVEFWIDDVKESTVTFSGTATEVRPTFHIQNGEAVAKTMTIDYLAIGASNR